MRINELARVLKLTSKELMDEMRTIGIRVSNHAQALTKDQLQRLYAHYKLGPDGQPLPEPSPLPTASVEAAPPVAPPEPTAVEAPKPPAPPESVLLSGPVIVKDLASLLLLKPNVLIAELMRMNVFASINQTIDLKTATKIAEKHGVKVEQPKPVEPPKPPETVSPPPGVAPPEQAQIRIKKRKDRAKGRGEDTREERPDELELRPPVVTFMGHVDHGKTSLLDCIRKARVAAGEAGGITQHMGAYMVEVNDKKITFLDTPGHAAFTAMRARGANLTDIAVIVIAADEGIKPQTKEAIQHARAANVAIMVAINKTDLPAANIDRVKGQLQQEDLSPEDWGGKTICVPVSATTGDGVDHLLEMILLQAEMLELKAAPRKKAVGHVLEARLEPGMGPTATLLIQAGTLEMGDTVVCGDYWGKVKAIINDRGVKLRTAGPSMAVKCLGLTAVPDAGSEFHAVASERDARAFSEQRMAARRMESLQTPKRGVSLDDLLNQTDASTVRELPIVLKADVQGSLEAIQQALLEIKSTKVVQRIVLAGVGNITVNDALLAKASNAVVFGFHVSTEGEVPKVARREGVEIRLYSIIYELLDEVRAAMAGRLEPILRESQLGTVLVKQIFQLSKKGTVAGCLVKSGRITSRARVRVRRQGDIIYEGAVANLKRYQNDAAEVREGQECGLRLDNFQDYQPGDLVEAFDVHKIAQEL